MPSHPDDDLTLDPSAAGTRAAIHASVTARIPASTLTPGSIIAGRYRLVALLGRGAMGEVYRADDLTLDQPVALKFLPEAGAGAGGEAPAGRLAQLHNELRIARQVSHKNVCRLYDLGDADGRRFLTMEYVDGEFTSLVWTAAIVALWTAAMWAIYLALEPFVRRFWPDSLLGWSRLVAGHIRDPRVGRDVLTGAVCGVVFSFINLAKALIPPRLGYASPLPSYGTAVDVLAGPGSLVTAWIGGSARALQFALLTVLVFVVLRLLLRRIWLSTVAGAVMLTFVSVNNLGGGTPIVLLFPIASGVLLTFVVVRFGLLPYAVTLFVTSLVSLIPLSLDVSHWSAVPSNWTLALVVALTAFGFYASRAGQPLFGTLMNE